MKELVIITPSIAGQVTLTCPTVEEEVRCRGAKVEKGEE